MQEKSTLEEESGDTVIHLNLIDLLKKAFLFSKEFFNLM